MKNAKIGKMITEVRSEKRDMFKIQPSKSRVPTKQILSERQHQNSSKLPTSPGRHFPSIISNVRHATESSQVTLRKSFNFTNLPKINLKGLQAKLVDKREKEYSTDTLKKELEKLSRQYEELIKESAKVENEVRRCAREAHPLRRKEQAIPEGLKHIDIYEQQLKAIEQKNISLANKIIRAEGKIADQTNTVNKYSKVISAYQQKFTNLSEEEKFNIVQEALRNKELVAFVKRKQIFRKYLNVSLSSLEF
jgi:hypothetical protein